MNKRFALGLIATAVLAGCGGGESANPVAQTSAAQPRAKALSVSATAISASDIANQLMDFAENSIYASFFPKAGKSSTQSLPPFLYRAYANGVLLGVASGNNPNYPDGVYVMGGPFGDAPLYQGPVTNFITPIDTSVGPSNINNGCHDLNLAETAGNRFVIAYRLTGETNGTSTVDSTVGNVTGFEGNAQAREISTKVTDLGTSSSGSFDGTFEGKTYQRRTGDAEVTDYGSTSQFSQTQGGTSVTFSSKSVNTPPFADKQYGLAIGQSYTYTVNSTTTQTTQFGGVPATSNTSSGSYTETIKFVSREQVTVPAGTYNTCKFETRNPLSTNVTTDWVIDGKGLSVKSTDANANGVITQTQEATSVLLNGQRL